MKILKIISSGHIGLALQINQLNERHEFVGLFNLDIIDFRKLKKSSAAFPLCTRDCVKAEI